MNEAAQVVRRIARAWAVPATRRSALGACVAAALCGTAAHAQLAISDSGTPNFSQAIAVPPGVAGMSPQIGLSYAGGGVNGPVGYGWSIQGISSISRCPPVKAIDGSVGPVLFAASDKLCLDGQRLIQTDASGSPSTFPQTNDSLGGSGLVREFRTEKDSYARIRAYGYANSDSTGASGPAYFKVWTKSGQVYEYGASPSADANTNAVSTPYQKTVAAVWAVSRVSDTLGNFIDFKYEQRNVAWGSGGTASAPTYGHEWNLLEIQYGGNKVVFNYTDRPDNTVGTVQDRGEAWHQGNKNVSIRLLRSVTTYINSSNTAALGAASGAVPVKTTTVAYGNGGVTGRSLVASIKECAGDASSTKCLPATTFNYAIGGSETYQANANFAGSPLATLAMISTTSLYTVLTGDFNGDGKTDILRLGNTPSDNQLSLSLGDGTFNTLAGGTGAGQFNLNTQQLFSSDGCYSSVVADFNGDGIADVLRTVQTTNNSGGACAAGTNVLFVGNGDGSFKAPVALTGIDLSALKEVFTSTVSSCVLASLPIRDGDLLAMADIPDMDVALTSGGTCYNQRKSIGKAFFVLDVNGDGILDIVTTVKPAYYVAYSSGDSIPTPDESCASVTCTHVYLGSASGAFTELTTTNLVHHSVYADPMTGTARSAIFKPNTLDVDGDGLLDLAVKTGIWRSSGDGNFTAVSGYNGACLNPIDANGDGRTDCLAATAAGATSNALITASGVQGGTTTPRFNLISAGQELTTPTSSTIALESVVVDINGDGRGDILRWSDDTTQNKLFLSNGDGSFRESSSFNIKDVSVSTAENQLRKSDGTYDFIIGDFTGRGTVEILRMAAAHTAPAGTSNQLFTKVTITPPDQLIGVSSGTGAYTSLQYVPLTNSVPSNGVSGSYGARYTSDRGTANAATSPSLDVIFPMYVVATSVSDNGIGGLIATEYSYAGFKADTTGRGLLGFREVRRQSPGPDPAGTPLTVSTQHLQSYPYIGAAARSDTRLGTVNNTSAQLLSSTVNAYCDITAASGADATAIANAQSNASTGYCPTTAKVQRPYLLWTKETGADLSGTALPSVTTQNTFQGSGDPTQIVVTTVGNVAGASQTFTKTTSNLYLTDNTAGDAWVLGRLYRASVQSAVPNILASLTTVAGSSANASAIKGTAPLPPLTAAQLMPILQLLLDD